MRHIVILPNRAVLAVEGEDRVGYLQGLVSNDVAAASPDVAQWSALLTPQGKFVADFFIVADAGRLLLDVQRDQAAMIQQRLNRFRLRARVAVTQTSLDVYAAWGTPSASVGIVAADARLPTAGWRILTDQALTTSDDFAAWDLHRLRLGLPDGTRDMDVEKTVLLEAGFDELGGVSWSKGCYMGQELTARTRYRGLLKRRLVPVQVEGALPEPATPITRDGIEVGSMRSGRDDRGMALLRLEAIGEPLICGEAVLIAEPPPWMRLAATG